MNREWMTMNSQSCRPIARAAGLAIVCLALGACTTASWQQMFYDVGDNYACQQAGANQGDAKARATQCGDSGHPDRSRYADYKTARDQTLSKQP